MSESSHPQLRFWLASVLVLASGCHEAHGGDDPGVTPPSDAGAAVDARPEPDAGPIPMPPPPAAPHVMRCDGDEEVHVELGDALVGTEAITVELWFRFARVLPWDAPRETLLLGLDGSGRGPSVGIAASGFSFEEYRHLVGSVAVQTPDGEAAGGHGAGWLGALDEEWHHFAVVAGGVATGPSLTIYYDGQRKPPASWPDEEIPDVDLRELFLCGAIGPTPFDGWIDDVRISRTRRYGREDFVPPAEPLVDAHTVLILDFEGGEVADRSGHDHPVTADGVELVSSRDGRP